MDLFLIRHAQAAQVEATSLYGADEERPLTAEGRRAAREVGRALAAERVGFDAIVVSPLVRAVETAELIAVETGFPGGLEVSPLLQPEGKPYAIIEQVIEAKDAPRLALVGHEPSMGKLLSALVGKPGLSMSKGAAVRLDWNGKHGRLVWVVKPKKLAPVDSLDGL